MREVWQELNSLKKEVALLKKLLAKQPIKTNTHPAIRAGKILSKSMQSQTPVYEVQEIAVNSEKSNICIDVKRLPNDNSYELNQSVVFYIDDEGERYILPGPPRLIPVRDQGENTAQEVSVSETGVVTVPEDSETLSYVVAEPTDFFHESTPPTQTGRIYPAIKCVKSDNSGRYYLVFVEGHGQSVKTFTANADISAAENLTFTIGVDGQGNVITLSVAGS